MANELLDFKNEKKEAYIDNALRSVFAGSLSDDHLHDFKDHLDDCFNAAFDFGLDCHDNIGTAEERAKWEREERLIQVRRTALELAKTNLPEFLSYGDNLQGLVIMALRFESLLDNIVK